MKYIIIISIFFIFALIATEEIEDIKYKKKLKEKGYTKTADDNQNEFEQGANKIPITGAYQSKWLLTYNEKDAFRKIKIITDELGCYIFSKVRLLDLLEPVKGNPKYKTYFYKVQAKHVDFVILDEKLVARCVVELDDSSHDAADRKERDDFVDEALCSVGYQVIRARAVTEEIQQQIRDAMKTK